MVPKKDGIPKETVEKFLNNGIAMMESEKTCELLKDKYSAARPGLKLIELQRAEWDTLGIDKDYGCAVLDKIEELYPGNNGKELHELKKKFVMTAQNTYLRSLRDRQPTSKETKASIPRETIFEFFDACNTHMDMPETKEKLIEYLREKKSMPNQIIIEMQKDMLEILGYEKDHGCAMLSRIGQDFPDDGEMHQRFQFWQRKAQQTCMMAVTEHRQTGGDLPGGQFGDNPELDRLRDQAKADLNKMMPEKRGLLVMKMQKKIQVFVNLPDEARQHHMKKLSEAEKLDFVKAQLLIVSMMKEQWADGGACPHHGPHSPGAQQSMQAGPAATEAAPQQEMM